MRRILTRVPRRGRAAAARIFQASRQPAAIGAALLALAGVAAADGAAPSPGRYEGHSAQHGAVRLDVGPHGDELVAYRLTGRFPCRGVRGHVNWRIGPIHGVRQTPIAIHPDGSFGATIHVTHRLRLPDGVVRRVQGAYTLRGRFTAASSGALTAQGRLRAVATGPRALRCDSRPQRWSARPAS